MSDSEDTNPPTPPPPPKRSSLRSSLASSAQAESPDEHSPKRKSVTWSDSEATDSVPNKRGSLYGVGTQGPRTSIRTIPKLRRSTKRSLLNKKPSSTSALLRKKCCGCCASSQDSDSSDGYEDLRPSTLVTLNEEEIAFRLHLAVRELSTRPTNYEIDAEIQRWDRALEIEHRQYEDSGKPKFKYLWFRKNQYLTPKKHPLYGTNYENHRMLEVRLEEFRFGSTTAANDKLRYSRQLSYESKESTYWRSDSQVFYANFALLCCASNFLRFPQACYANGGFTFLLTYCIMIALVGQPLLYLEMALGQYSLHGPSGFSMLHPYARGIPYAIAFVCISFGTSKSIYLAYCVLYSLISLIASPGYCGWWWSGGGQTKCVSYQSLEKVGDYLKKERAREKDNLTAAVIGARPFHSSAFSVELFFREVMLNTDWKTGLGASAINWKIVLGYFLVCCCAMVPIHYNLSGRNMKRYLRWSSIIPTCLIALMFLHQIFGRGGLSLAAQYFLFIDSKHVSALSLWSEAFEMVLSTLGIGYGFHWSISGNISIDYRNTYRISWHICGYAILLGMLSSLVLFCEVGFVGEFTGDDSHYNVFFERLGITFVCFSGALLKLGGNSVIFIFLVFLCLVLYGMWSHIIVSHIILRWLEHGFIIKGTRTHQTVRRTKTTLAVLVGVQLVLISPHCFSKRGAVLASENIFGGSFAAIVIVLAELVIVNYLYGFARFNADLEIMTKRATSYTFQFQIRYLVIPIILIFMIPMIINVYVYPSFYLDRNKLGWLFYLGLFANFAPVLIILFGIKYDLSFILKCTTKSPTVNKVVPHFFYPPGGTPEKYGASEEARNRYPLMEPKFVAKENAPSQQGHGRNIRSEIYHVVEYNTSFVHKCEDYVKTKFLELKQFKVNQARWILLSLAALQRTRIKSMPGLVSRIMLARKYRNDKMDIRFLNAALEQIVNLTFASAIRKLQRMPVQEMLLYLANELIKLTTFRAHDTEPYNVATFSSSSSSSSSESSTSDAENNNSSTSSSSEGGDAEKAKRQYIEIHRKLIGQIYRNPEESRTLLTIRLKRGLGLPHLVEISVLKYLRRERAKQERELSCWTQRDKMPVDHYIPSTIRNPLKQKICFTIFHAVVVEGSDHFVLRKLPVPKPAIVRVTKQFVNSQPGDSLTDKFTNIVTKRMHRNIGQIVVKRDLRHMSKKKLQRHFWKVSDRVDDDVYDFLDRILTCVIVVIPDWEAKEKVVGGVKRILTPRARRKSPPGGRMGKRRLALTDHEIQSYGTLNYKQRQEAYWSKLLEEAEPPDLRYHQGSSDSDEDPVHMKEDEEPLDVYSSSGSSSTLSSDDQLGEKLPPQEAEEGVEDMRSTSTIGSVGPVPSFSITSLDSTTWRPARQALRDRASKSELYLLANETLQQRDKRLLLRKSGFGVPGLQEKESELTVILDIEKIKHISARRWKHDHDMKMKQESKKVKFAAKDLMLHRKVDAEALSLAAQAVASKSMEVLKMKRSKKGETPARKAVSLESIRHFLESDAQFAVDLNRGAIVAISKDKVDARTRSAEVKLKNANPELMYLGYGKTLIVDHGVKVPHKLR